METALWKPSARFCSRFPHPHWKRTRWLCAAQFPLRLVTGLARACEERKGMSALLGMLLAIPFFVLAVIMRVRVFVDDVLDRDARVYKKSMAASTPNMSAAVLDSCLARFWLRNMPMLLTARPGSGGRTCGPSS